MIRSIVLTVGVLSMSGPLFAADAPRKDPPPAAKEAATARQGQSAPAGGSELAYDYKTLDANKDGYVTPDEMIEHDKRRAAAQTKK